MAGVWPQAGVRVLPPLIALLTTSVAIYLQWSGLVLLSAALMGYAVGAAWLFPVLLKLSHSNSGDISVVSHTEASTVSGISTTKDDRSTALRMTHTLADALLATAFVVVWHRFYGEQETGWIAAPLRVMGFVPAVVHMAWAQVVLAQPQHSRTNPLWVGFGGVASVALLGIGCAFALEIGFLSEEWQGVRPYLLPLVLWQGSACIAAALSHTPFESNLAYQYSWICISLATIQVFILSLPITINFPSFNTTSKMHFELFGFTSSLGLLAMSYWLQQISPFQASKHIKA
jgi:hypothetical protein